MSGRALAALARLDKGSCHQKSDLQAVAVRQRLLAGRDRRALLSPQELRMRERRKLCGGPVGLLGRQVRGRALLENSHGVRETTFDVARSARPDAA